MKIAITNHTGGRNRGCEALVRTLTDGFAGHYPTARFSLHSQDPLYDRWRFGERLTPLWSYPTMTPNHSRWLAANRLGYATAGLAERALPTLRGIGARCRADLRGADAVVASGGDIFTSDYHNLRKHLAYPLMAGQQPVYLCGQTIGPFTPTDRDYFLRIAERINLITVREPESLAYLRSLDVQTRVEQTADVAFTLKTWPKATTRAWLKQRYGLDTSCPTVALSVSQGIIRYSGLNAEHYYAQFAGLCNALLDAGKQVLLVPHVMERMPGNNDVIACEAVAERVRTWGKVRILAGEPGAVAMKSAIGTCQALIGTRTHATIASMSQKVPTVSVAYSRKAYGIMRDVYGGALADRLIVPAEALSIEAMLAALDTALAHPIDTRRLADVTARAEGNFSLLESLS